MNPNLPETGILYSDLSQIPKALNNEKALFVLIATGLLTMGIVFVVAQLLTGSPVMSILLMSLTQLVILPAGTSIAGLLLRDQACGETPRPLRKAVSDGIPAFLRILGVMLISVLLMVAFLLCLSVLLFACKIPAVGPVLYAVLFPVLVILAGLLYFGLMAGLSMACPAVWNGATIRATLEIVWRIIAHRAVELLVNLFLLSVLIALAGFILTSIIFVGAHIILGMSVPILGDSFSGSLFTAVSGSKASFAVRFGFMTGLMLFLSAMTAMYLMGLNLIYLRITKNLPLLKAQEYAWNLMHQNKNREEPIIQPIRQATVPGGTSGGAGNLDVQHVRDAGGSSGSMSADTGSDPDGGAANILASLLAEAPSAPPPVEKAKTIQICPHCRTPAEAGDRFCGECGGSLQG
jgi:hypothetical protein